MVMRARAGGEAGVHWARGNAEHFNALRLQFQMQCFAQVLNVGLACGVGGVAGNSLPDE
jgi:hypothetical protein